MYSKQTYDPSDLLSKISSALIAEHQGAVFLTCFLGVFSSREKTLTYVNAGHPPGIVFSHHGDHLLECSGTPVGMFSNSDYPKGTLSFECGTVGVLFTTNRISEALPIEADSLPEFLRGTILRKRQDQNPQEDLRIYIKIGEKEFWTHWRE